MRPVVGVLTEAWGEVRVHRARVVLSLVGVFLAVFAMTVVTAAGQLGAQAVRENAERTGGRDTTLTLYASPPAGGADLATATAFYRSIVQQFDVGYASLVMQNSGPPLGVGDANGVIQSTTTYAVDPEWAAIHRVVPVRGRFVAAGDAQRLVPAVVVNGYAADALGIAGRSLPVAVRPSPGAPPFLVVGQISRDEYGPEVVSLLGGPSWVPLGSSNTPGLELWVPPARADELRAAIDDAVRSRGWQGETQTSSQTGLGTLISGVQWGILGISLVTLALGALGVLNVGIVTVRQRIREIGVRRALGASSARIFAAIMFESVVATALAGALAIVLVVAVFSVVEHYVPTSFVSEKLGVDDLPPFPVAAAVEAFAAASGIGALAGLVPAIIAVRAKVIDAIRY